MPARNATYVVIARRRGDVGRRAAERKEQRGGVVDELLAAHVDAAVEPGHEELGQPADEDRGTHPADLTAARAREGIDHLVAGFDAAPVQRFVPERLDVEHAPAAAVLVDELDGASDRRPQVGRGRKRDAELVDDAVVDGDDQLVEILEALVEVARVQSRPLAHGPHGRAARPFGAEQLERGVDQERAPLSPPVGGRHPGPTGRRTERRDTWQRPLP